MNETKNRKPAAAAPTRRAKPAAAIGGEWCVGIASIGPDGALSVTSGDLYLRAARAASCLLAPASGDSVACLRIAPDEAWIMGVLQREEGTPNVVSCAGGMRIAADEGGIELAAPRIDLNATQSLDIATQRVRVAADTADLVGRQVSLVGSTVKLVGSVLSSVMDRVQHYSRSYARTTDGIDRVAATHIECEAQQLLRLEGEHALINGKELVKARGAQIHFG
jgi:hypothetical protein